MVIKVGHHGDNAQIGQALPEGQKSQVLVGRRSRVVWRMVFLSPSNI